MKLLDAEEIIANLPAGLVVLDKSLTVHSVNRSFQELFDVGGGRDVAGQDLEELLPVAGLREQALGVLASGIGVHGIEAAVDGKQLRMAITGVRPAENGECLLVVLEDVTCEHALRTEARMHEQRFQDLVQQMDAIVWEADAETFQFTFVSRRAEDILGYPVERWLAEPDFWVKLIHPDDREQAVAYCKAATEKGSDHAFDYRAVAADGRVVWQRDIVRVVWDEAKRKKVLRGVMVDITEHKEAESRLAHLASHDALTGLPNRNLLADRLRQALIAAARYRHSVGVLFLDLDRFKTINDSLGHGTGDQLLKAVAERLRSGVREGDTVARVGGDEFVMIVGDVDQPHDAVRVARKVLDNFVAPFRVQVQEAGGGVQEFFFTSSIGISLYPADGEDGQTLLKNADAAMYRAKAGGGNGFQFFTPEMDVQERKRLSLENALRTALEQQQFVLHYQPQIDLATNSMIGVEALLRWSHPEKGLVPLPDFIPLLEETGFIVAVGEWVLRTACAQHRVWREAGLEVPRVAVNLSARQLRHERFLESVERALADAGMDPGSLELEITESVVMEQVEASLETLRRVRALGVRLSMDDFGTGYSSLSHLKLLPVNAVKADQTFVRGVPTDESDAAIVESVIALARTLRLDVIAEGVETEAQSEFLRARGCDTMQGYLFSRPLPGAGLAGFVRSRGNGAATP